jgi:hypothetical protein
MNRGLRFAFVLIGVMVMMQPVYAAISGPVKYVMYSWKDGNEWVYSLLPASKEHEVLAEIKHVGGPLRGAGKIKEKLLGMKEGDQISWKSRTEANLVYPPDPIKEDIEAYARTVGVKLSIASQ